MNRVRNLLTRYHPRFAHADYSIVERWIAEGADLERDILPVIREWTAKKKDIHSLGFFTRYIEQAKQAREAEKKADIHQLARNIAYAIRVVKRCMPTEERWLHSYENKYGPLSHSS